METTFITIHDLSNEARILYSSDSIVDILGYTPDEVVHRSCWDFFHPDELPLAREFHSRGVKLDKAAVLAYCQIQNRDGQWIGCECCFSVCYDVMVVCTSVYRQGLRSQQRAVEAPIVRRLFSSSPKDPRYHMLSLLSAKFQAPPRPKEHEPRAALFLNRFTRTLTIMYATSGLQEIIGISGEEMKGKSFYYCIQENCLQDAVTCLETAKGNDSIAYLRFWFRDPRQDEPDPPLDDGDDGDGDEAMTGLSSSGDSDDGGVHLDGHDGDAGIDAIDQTDQSVRSQPLSSNDSMDMENAGEQEHAYHCETRTSSGYSTVQDTHEAIFGERPIAASSSSSLPLAGSERDSHPQRRLQRRRPGPIELEAVVSCTSDGLVVCLRRARPIIPHTPQAPAQQVYANGLFAAPWAPQPIMPLAYQQPLYNYNPGYLQAPGHGALFPYNAPHAGQPDRSGPAQADLLNSIREVAVFAWALVGINGSLVEYTRGKPKGESQPPGGFPIWAPKQRPYENGSGSGSGSGFSSAAPLYQSGDERAYSDTGFHTGNGSSSGSGSGSVGH